MRFWLPLSAGLAVALMFWTGAALGQAPPACDAQAKMKTPEQVAGEVTKIDVPGEKVTVRQSDGTVHEFQASPETLRDLKVGGRVEAKLRQAPPC